MPGASGVHHSAQHAEDQLPCVRTGARHHIRCQGMVHVGRARGRGQGAGGRGPRAKVGDGQEPAPNPAKLAWCACCAWSQRAAAPLPVQVTAQTGAVVSQEGSIDLPTLSYE